MSTISITTQAPEVAMIQADCNPVDGWQIHWLISRKQIEYLLTDIVSLPPNDVQPQFERAQYLEQSLPVIHLEEYYGLARTSPQPGYRYLVTKFAAKNHSMLRAILKIHHPVRMRKLTFNSVPCSTSPTPKNGEHLLGAYTLPDNQIILIPDLFALVDKTD